MLRVADFYEYFKGLPPCGIDEGLSCVLPSFEGMYGLLLPKIFKFGINRRGSYTSSFSKD